MATNLTARLSNHVGTVAQSESPKDDVLCKRCARIDFKGIFALACPPEGRIVLNLGRLLESSPCPLCRLFHSTQFTYLPFRVKVVRTSQGPESWAVLRPVFTALPGPDEAIHEGEQAGLGITVVTNLTGEKPNMHDMRLQGRDELIIPVRSSTTASLRLGTVEGAPINRWKVDYFRIHGWLQQCDRRHSDTCSPLAQGRPLQLLCIDCHTMDIVPIGPGDEYFALSYVWGSRNGPPRAESSGLLPLNDEAPQVVRDAMIVVQELGKRYLWVDQFCINQANEDIKNRQIRHMDQVYEGAYATIVAAAGYNADFGLPGVSRSRFKQCVAETNDMTLMAAPPCLQGDLGASGWIKRGWTYQEAVLSRRLIIFTEHQVHFVCAVMTCGEAVVTGPEKMRIPPLERPITLNTSYYESFRAYPGCRE